MFDQLSQEIRKTVKYGFIKAIEIHFQKFGLMPLDDDLRKEIEDGKFDRSWMPWPMQKCVDVIELPVNINPGTPTFELINVDGQDYYLEMHLKLKVYKSGERPNA